MPRPPRFRRVGPAPKKWPTFSPPGTAGPARREIILGLDELEALRLADLGGLHHREAARRMGVSRPTFSRIVRAARRKVAEALLKGRPLGRVKAGGAARKGALLYCPGCRSAWPPSPLPERRGSCPGCTRGRARRGTPRG